MATDPICGMNVEEEKSAIKAGYDDRIYYFCSEDCRDIFQANPELYVQNAA